MLGMVSTNSCRLWPTLSRSMLLFMFMNKAMEQEGCAISWVDLHEETYIIIHVCVLCSPVP